MSALEKEQQQKEEWAKAERIRAAAPALLEACKAALYRSECQLGTLPESSGSDDAYLQRQLRAAIDAAEPR